MKYFDRNFSPKLVNKITLGANIITLSGSTTNGHSANITINNILNYSACTIAGGSMTTAAANWCAANYDYYKLRGFLVTSSGAVITVNPAHSWDSVNRINATIATVTGTLTGTGKGTLVIDGSKAKVWDVTFTTTTANIGAAIGLKNRDEIKAIFNTTVGTVITYNAAVVVGGGVSTTTLAISTPFYFSALYDSIQSKLIDQFNALLPSDIADNSVTTSKILNENVTTSKLANTLDLTGKVVSFSAKSGTPINAVAAAGLLTLTGTVADGETITVGSEVFEIDTDGVVTPGNIAIDVSAHATAAQGTITVSGTPVADESMIIAGTVYTFKAARSGPLEITISADNPTQVTNIIAAVTLDSTNVIATDGDGDTVIITAFTPGTVGNSLVFTESATGIAVDGAGTLGTTTLGADCTAANADGVIVTDATAGSSLIVATQGTGTTVLFTALVKGVSGNAIGFSTDLANGSVDDAVLGTAVEGVDGTVGAVREIVADATNIYMAIAANTIADANWRKLVLQTI